MPWTRPSALCFLALLLTLGTLSAAAQADLAAEVNPFIGTETSQLKDNGNTVPGASLPFGMLYWSPDPADSGTESGFMYRYEEPSTRGFSLLHLSGPGCGAFGDVPLFPMLGLPAVPPSVLPGSYRAGFRHADEVAQPGFYSVKLDSGVTVRLAAALRSGIAEVEYPAGADAHTLLLDLSRNLNRTENAHIALDGSHVSGSVSGSGFCGLRNRYTVYFSLHTEEAPQHAGTFDEMALREGSRAAEGPRAGGYLQFSPAARIVHLKVGVSFVSTENAERNLQAEIPGWQLAAVREAARATWNSALGHAVVSGGTRDERTVFYTAMYHSLLHPSTFSDSDGEYLGFDGKVHMAKGRTQYANFSGWDIYRSQVQLITMFYPKVGSDLAQSLVADAEEGGGLPIWPLANDESSCMVGDPSDLILANIYAFGGRDFDTASALRAMRRGAEDPNTHIRLYPERPGLAEFMKLGYVPETAALQRSASVTLEDENADFAISRFAHWMGDAATAKTYADRAAQWRKLMDPATHYIRSRDAKGQFLPDFEPGKYDGFVEGNSAQYTWMIPYDLPGLIEAMGGDAVANRRLDSYFSQYGSYALNRGPFFYIANEPSFGNPWLYNWTGEPWRTDEVVRKTLTDLFHNTPGGLPGNDDLGATSSWVVFAQLGLFPEIPAVAGFTTNSPTFPKATLLLDKHKVELLAPKAPAARYVGTLTMDGKRVQDHWIRWEDLQHATTVQYGLTSAADKTPAGVRQAPPQALD